MIQLGNIATDISKINPAWSFSYYCKVPEEAFNGASVKIKSVFKPDEKTASFVIYPTENKKIHFKCFSTSYSGDHINLVQYLFNMNYTQSCHRIINDYTKWVLDGKAPITGDFNVEAKYKVTGFIKRTWTQKDADFWLPFNIGSSRLAWGNVFPLKAYKMENSTDSMVITGDNLYGYFTKKGQLYKIYQPLNKDCKFLNVQNNYEIGSEHDNNNDYAVILSSWKDAMCFENFGLKIDMKVPPSENSFFSQEYIEKLKKKYKKVFTLLDADDAGKKAMLKYKKLYDLDYLWFPLSKDLSDSVRDFGNQKVLITLVPKIHKLLN